MNDCINETLARFFSRHAAGIKFDLSITRALLERLDNPERGLIFIHVAGSNGKGSVCCLLDSILRQLVPNAGLYTSPHLVRFNERIRIGGRPVSDEVLAEAIVTVEAAAQAVEGASDGRLVTFFEFATALAFLIFRRQGVDWVVLETGMGGRLDSTNVVTPLISVITGIALDHTEYLGRDIESIAREKGGIIKPGRPLILGSLPAAAQTVLEARARECAAPVIMAAETVSVRRQRQDLDGQSLLIESGSESYGTARCQLLGRHQLGNLAVAVTAMETLRDYAGLPLTPQMVRDGLAQARWPARCQVLQRDPLIILDGAHNPQCAEALAMTLRELCRTAPVALVTGMCADKDSAGFFQALAGRVRRCWTVRLRSARSTDPAALAELAGLELGCEAQPASLATALQAAAGWAVKEKGLVCIAGSLYLAGEVLEHYGLADRLFD